MASKVTDTVGITVTNLTDQNNAGNGTLGSKANLLRLAAIHKFIYSKYRIKKENMFSCACLHCSWFNLPVNSTMVFPFKKEAEQR